MAKDDALSEIISIRKDMGDMQADIARANAIADRMGRLEDAIERLSDHVGKLYTKAEGAAKGNRKSSMITAAVLTAIVNGIIQIFILLGE